MKVPTITIYNTWSIINYYIQNSILTILFISKLFEISKNVYNII